MQIAILATLYLHFCFVPFIIMLLWISFFNAASLHSSPAVDLESCQALPDIFMMQ